jgi:hypothetical protein
MYIRVRPVSSHGMILMLSRTLGIETFSAWTLGLLLFGTLPWSPIWYLISRLHSHMKYSANWCTEAASSSVSGCGAAVVFQQDGVLAFYGEYNPQWINTKIHLYLFVAWGMITGYLASLHVIYLKKQSYQAMCFAIFQNYCLTRNQVKGTLCENLFSYSIIFHLELVRITSNNLTQSCAIHWLCNIFLSTIQKHYKHPQFLYRHNFSAVYVKNNNELVFVTRILYLMTVIPLITRKWRHTLVYLPTHADVTLWRVTPR